MAAIHRNGFDRGTIIGMCCGFGLMALAIALGGGLTSFIDLGSLLIVLGGTIGGTLVTFPAEDVSKGFAILRNAFIEENFPAHVRLQKILDLAKRSRVNGILSLENELFREADPFMQKCVALAVDGLPADDVRRIMNIELSLLSDRHRRGAEIFSTMGQIAPAMGLIGTLIGLVQMLRNLASPEAIGPGMAVALLTTFYGAVLAHLLFLPIAGKLRKRSQEEALLKEMTIEGVISIVEGTNPQLLEQKLQGFLAPEVRQELYR